MKFNYVANVMLPSTKAHCIQIVNTCIELNKKCLENGIDFKLFVNDRDMFGEDFFSYFGIKKVDHFNYKKIKILNLRKPEYLFFWLQFFLLAARVLVSEKISKKDIFYTRDWPLVIIFYILGFRKIFFEAHGLENRWINRYFFRRIKGVVCISDGLKKDYDLFCDPKKVFVVHDAVNLNKFRLNESKEEARRKLGLDSEKKIITYIGSVGMYDWKGVNYFLEAGQSNNDPEIVFMVVGVLPHEFEEYKKKYPKINFVVRQKQDTLPLYQKASDVLVIPNKKDGGVSEKYTSPLKLFEYMASGTPILASNISSLREILKEDNATFFEANNSSEMHKKINFILSNWHESLVKANKAIKDVEDFSYEKRAENILNFVINLSK